MGEDSDGGCRRLFSLTPALSHRERESWLLTFGGRGAPTVSLGGTLEG